MIDLFSFKLCKFRYRFYPRCEYVTIIFWSSYYTSINPLRTNPAKWSNTLKQFVDYLATNCLSVFDHFVGLALNGLSGVHPLTRTYREWLKKCIWLTRIRRTRRSENMYIVSSCEDFELTSVKQKNFKQTGIYSKK